MDAFDVDIAIIGSGFSGLGMAIRLKQDGLEDFTVLERGDDVGGTWHFNTYPGCACDVPSHLYSFSFAPNPGWSETYSRQPEIRDYLRRVADDYGLRPHVRTGCDVTGVVWSDGGWNLETSDGPLRARVVVAGTGPLAEPRTPPLQGLECRTRAGRSGAARRGSTGASRGSRSSYAAPPTARASCSCSASSSARG
jgi:cation diffusion facilitator CzcD-associated flavoprotein CzcO